MSDDKKGSKKNTKRVSPKHPSKYDCFEGLNSQQSKFVRLYVATGNARQSALDAGYTHKTSGNNLLNQERVAYWVKKEKKRIAEKLEITAEKVLYELGRIGFAKLTDVLDFGPGGITIKNSKTLPEDVQAAIQEVSETVTGKSTTLKVKMHDKLGSLDKLAKHFGLYDRDKEENQGDPLEALRKAILSSQPGKKDEEPAPVEEEDEDLVEDDSDEDDEDEEDEEE